MSTTERQLTQRIGSPPDLVTLLREQHAAKLDVVIPAAGIRSSGGRSQIDGTGTAVLGSDGVTTSFGRFVPTGTCDAGMADKLGIPVAYLRRLREEHLGLYDANVNGWLEHQPGRRLLIRALRGNAGDGIARAVLSERYRFVDNLDVLLAVLDGIRRAGADVEVRRCDPRRARSAPSRSSTSPDRPPPEASIRRPHQPPVPSRGTGSSAAGHPRILANHGLLQPRRPDRHRPTLPDGPRHRQTRLTVPDRPRPSGYDLRDGLPDPTSRVKERTKIVDVV